MDGEPLQVVYETLQLFQFSAPPLPRSGRPPLLKPVVTLTLIALPQRHLSHDQPWGTNALFLAQLLGLPGTPSLSPRETRAVVCHVGHGRRAKHNVTTLRTLMQRTAGGFCPSGLGMPPRAVTPGMTKPMAPAFQAPLPDPWVHA